MKRKGYPNPKPAAKKAPTGTSAKRGGKPKQGTVKLRGYQDTGGYLQVAPNILLQKSEWVIDLVNEKIFPIGSLHYYTQGTLLVLIKKTLSNWQWNEVSLSVVFGLLCVCVYIFFYLFFINQQVNYNLLIMLHYIAINAT